MLPGETYRWRARWAVLVSIGLLCFVLLALLSCGETRRTAGLPLPSGWRWYQDGQFHFQVPIPPEWRANAYMAEYVAGDRCAHEVDLVPPVSERNYIPFPPGPPRLALELIRVVVTITCPDWTPANNRHLTPESQPIMISGASATLYNDKTLVEGINQLTVTRFGGHQFLFEFEYDYTDTTPSTKAQENLTLYRQVLQGFVYKGT